MTNYEQELLLKLYLKYGTGDLPFEVDGSIGSALKIQFMGYVDNTYLWTQGMIKTSDTGPRLSVAGVKRAQQLLMERLDKNEST